MHGKEPGPPDTNAKCVPLDRDVNWALTYADLISRKNLNECWVFLCVCEKAISSK